MDQQDNVQDSESVRILECTENTENMESSEPVEDYVNSVGIRFTSLGDKESLASYGIPCIRELFKFLISLCNPLDTQNTDAMMQISLNLLTVVFEVATDNIGNYCSLIAIVKDDLCRNLFGVRYKILTCCNILNIYFYNFAAFELRPFINFLCKPSSVFSPF